MTMVDTHQAETQLSRLLERVIAGEEIVIAKAGVPVARLVPVARDTSDRVPGRDRDRLVVADDFEAPLPDEVLDDFAVERVWD